MLAFLYDNIRCYPISLHQRRVMCRYKWNTHFWIFGPCDSLPMALPQTNRYTLTTRSAFGTSFRAETRGKKQRISQGTAWSVQFTTYYKAEGRKERPEQNVTAIECRVWPQLSAECDPIERRMWQNVTQFSAECGRTWPQLSAERDPIERRTWPNWVQNVTKI